MSRLCWLLSNTHARLRSWTSCRAPRLASCNASSCARHEVLHAKKVRFQHCDPAGIVFYPQYFVLLHEVQEDFLAHIGFAEHSLIANGMGRPVVDMKAEFLGMCRHGDVLIVTLTLTRIGIASLAMPHEIHSPAQVQQGFSAIKLRAISMVVYFTVPHGNAVRIPDDLRTALQPYLQTMLEAA